MDEETGPADVVWRGHKLTGVRIQCPIPPCQEAENTAGPEEEGAEHMARSGRRQSVKHMTRSWEEAECRKIKS